MSDRVVISGSIRRRLTVRLVVSAALVSGLLFLLVLNFARTLVENSQDNILIASVTSVLDSTSLQDGEVTVDIPYAALSMLGNVSDDRVFYRVLVGGTVLTGYDDLPPPPDAVDDQGRSFLTADYSGESIRMVSASRRLAGSGAPIDVVASVAQTRGGQAETLRLIWRNAAILGTVFFIVAALLAVLAAQSAVDPLRRLAESVARRGPSDLRPVRAAVPTEMAPLVRSLNTFMGRLRTTLTRSEDLIAEAAHRVRTPLATVRAQAEVALGRVERQENRDALKRMIRAIDESSRAAGQLLDHAMVTFRTDQLSQRRVDMGELTEETVTRIEPVAGLKEISVATTAPAGIEVEGDPILLQSAISNVLDNAIKYSPEDTEITVDLTASDGLARLSIRDGGPGFPDGAGAELTGRFVRGANAEGTVGSGLGLTIAEAVAEAHGGHLTIENNTEGCGACVSLFVPLA